MLLYRTLQFRFQNERGVRDPTEHKAENAPEDGIERKQMRKEISEKYSEAME